MCEEKTELPFEIRALHGVAQNKMMQDFKGERLGFVQVGPENYFLPKTFEVDGPKLYSFKPRPDDTWIITFPRSGTTLTQELIWLLSNGLDFEKAKSIPLYERFPFIEFSTTVTDDLKQQLMTEAKNDTDRKYGVEEATKPVFEILESSKSPRFIKTHLPFSLLPPDLLHVGAKVVYVARNPRDVAVSYFHLYKLFRTLDFQGDFKRFWTYFENGHVLWAPYWSHIEEGWKLRSHPNVCFLFYEDVIQDLSGSIEKICDFLNKKISGEEMKKLLEHLHISNFRSNSSVNFESLRKLGFLNGESHLFIRDGKINGSQQYFSDDLNERAQIWIEENSRKIKGFKFPNKLNQSG